MISAAPLPFAPCVMFSIEYTDGLGQPVPVRVISRGLADESCTIETYLYRDASGRKVRCSLSMLYPTKQAAFAHLVELAEQEVPAAEKAVSDAQQRLADAKAGIVRLKALAAQA